MSASTFIEADVLVYQIDVSGPRKQAIVDGIIRDPVYTNDARISYQATRELLTRPATRRFSRGPWSRPGPASTRCPCR